MTLPLYHPPYSCAVCGRGWRGFAFSAPDLRVYFCSMQCSEVYMIARAAQIELTKDEAEAAIAGGKAAGSYLETLHKSDLMDLTGAEWEEFCQRLVAEAFADLQRQADAAVPF